MSATFHDPSIAVGSRASPHRISRPRVARAGRAVAGLGQLLRPLWRFAPAGMNAFGRSGADRDPDADPAAEQTWAATFDHSLFSR